MKDQNIIAHPTPDCQIIPSIALNTALAYAEKDWRIFPIKPGAKTPLTEHGCKDATTSPEIIKGWWMRWPAANVGIATGRESNLVAFDFDIRNGQQGQQTYMDLLDRYGTIETLTSTTPSGGWHLFFQYPDIPVSNRAGLLPGLDIRGVWWLYRGTRIKYARGRIHLEKPYPTGHGANSAKSPAGQRQGKD